ncbi:hypothetical protein NIES970_28220 (plasmid) [[Synechococcus] sp. NIES-970]|nr:hypothetical protein NIES970_28220 [[Synechococcus] sp. NIES-970]
MSDVALPLKTKSFLMDALYYDQCSLETMRLSYMTLTSLF